MTSPFEPRPRGGVDPEAMLVVGLSVALVLAVAGGVYVSLTAGGGGAAYTEFYVLGPDGTASDYPTNLTVGESGTVVVGVTNRENEPVTYTVVLELRGRRLAERSVSLDDGATWEGAFSFSPETAGDGVLQLYLYDTTQFDDDTEPYRELRLHLNVSRSRSLAAGRDSSGAPPPTGSFSTDPARDSVPISR